METDFLKMFEGLGTPLQQGLLLLGAVVFLGFGGALFLGWIVRREKTVACEAKIIGLRAFGGVFYPVYEYRDDSGNLVEATGEDGERSPRDIQTGEHRQINVLAERPDIAVTGGRKLGPVIGPALIAFGLYMLFTAFTRFPVDVITIGTLLIVIIYFSKNLRHKLPRTGSRKEIAHWRAQKREAFGLMPLETPEQLMEDPQAKAYLEKQEKTLRLMGPVYMLAGAAALAAGLYLGGGMLELHLRGTDTRGIVTESAAAQDDRGPVVHFRDKQGNAVRFEGKVRFDMPTYADGEEVCVLYMESDPAGTAAIDIGFRGWALPFFLAALGAFSLLTGIAAMPRQRDEVR